MTLAPAHRTDADKLARRLRHQVGLAIADYALVGEGDRVMVRLSGGKNSYCLLDTLRQLKVRAPVRLELVVAHLDQEKPDCDAKVLPGYLRSIDRPFEILEHVSYSVVKPTEGKNLCGLCSLATSAPIERSPFPLNQKIFADVVS